MKISIYGLWHLGVVTAACLADKDFQVVGLSDEKEIIDDLKKGIPPLYETGLEDLIKKNLNKNLNFTTDKNILKNTDLLWVNFDTPVDDNDNADTEFVINKIKSVFPYLKDNSAILISSQLPVGTTNDLLKIFNNQYRQKTVYFAYSPENLRLGKAIEVFNNQERVIVGFQNEEIKNILIPVLSKYTDNIIWMGIKSAEMVKHSLNAFLAISVTFINEIATLCEKVGANAAEVEEGLKSENRIGKKAYLRPGEAFAGGTLARDIRFLCNISDHNQIKLPLLHSVIPSNEFHKKWIQNKILEYCPDLSGKKIAIVGLSYKSGTSTLRRSKEIELCDWLNNQKAKISAFDQDVGILPDKLSYIDLVNNIKDLCMKADILIIAKKFAVLDDDFIKQFILSMKKPLIIDQNRLLENNLNGFKDIIYITTGTSYEIK